MKVTHLKARLVAVNREHVGVLEGVARPLAQKLIAVGVTAGSADDVATRKLYLNNKSKRRCRFKEL